MARLADLLERCANAVDNPGTAEARCRRVIELRRAAHDLRGASMLIWQALYSARAELLRGETSPAIRAQCERYTEAMRFFRD